MTMRNLLKVAASLFAAAVLLGPLTTAAQQLTKVTLRTDYRVNGYVGVFALARERGFYREEGLDVEIGEGQGSSTTIQTVAVGDDTFGLADSTALVVGISARGIPVKAVSVYSQSGIQGFAYHPDSGWDGNIENMRRKVLVSSPGSAELTVIPAILATAGMSMKDIDLQLADLNARIPLFVQTPGSFTGGYATGDILRVRKAMPNVGYVPFSKYGIVAYGTSLITKNTTIQNNPELVRKFISASARGWEVAVKDPEAAVGAAMKLFPASDAQLLRDGLRIMIAEQLHTPATGGKPIGWMAESDWKAMIALLQKYAEVKPKDISTYYTNDFIAKP